MKSDVTPTDKILEYEAYKNKPNTNLYSSYENYGSTPMNIKQAAINMKDERSRYLDQVSPIPQSVQLHPMNMAQYYEPRYQPQPQFKRVIPLRGNGDDNNQCISTLEHIKSCPVCSKLHNSDRTWHIAIIIGLIIVIILLLRKEMKLFNHSAPNPTTS